MGEIILISTYMQNYFDEDICVIILSNNESINQYRLGHAISDILHQVDVDFSIKHEELPINEKELKKYCGTYLKDKIQVELINGKLYFTRFSGNLHVEVYPVGEGRFARRYFDQTHPYSFTQKNGKMTFFGYDKDDSAI
ncbi:hypothetical protein WMW72_27105 [Paenibacillus filicis]|uniref:Uncharacterized protein n=2 Tax=Paenibacillus filicis TaxID=669464 RepID=A0ABU9DRW8_9BACL